MWVYLEPWENNSWEKCTFERTRGVGLSNPHTSLPERLMYPPLIIQQWAHEHCGVYPGSSSHRSTYFPHCCGLRCCMIGRTQKSPKVGSMQTLNSRHMMQPVFQIRVHNRKRSHVGGGFTLHDTGTLRAYLPYTKRHHKITRWGWWALYRAGAELSQQSACLSKLSQVRPCRTSDYHHTPCVEQVPRHNPHQPPTNGCYDFAGYGGIHVCPRSSCALLPGCAWTEGTYSNNN